MEVGKFADVGEKKSFTRSLIQFSLKFLKK